MDIFTLKITILILTLKRILWYNFCAVTQKKVTIYSVRIFETLPAFFPNLTFGIYTVLDGNTSV